MRTRSGGGTGGGTGRRTVVALVAIVLALTLGPGVASAQVAVEVFSPHTSIDFPNSLTFHLHVTSKTTITGAEVRYQVEQLSCGSGTASGFAEFTPGTDLDVSWEWDLRERGGLPPGSRVTYWWVLSGEEGTYRTGPTTVVFEDPRFEWRTIAGEHTRLKWYEGTVEFARDLLDAADAGIRQLEASTGVLPSQPVEVRIYADSAAMREAVVFSQEWAGGIAYPEHGLVAMGINEFNLAWGRRATVHEMSHVVIAEASFTCGASLPAWLDEGLATFNEGPEERFFTTLMDEAVNDNAAYAVRGLAGSFPGSRDGAALAYAESRSLVAFLIEKYGPVQMNALLEAFQRNATIDRALTEVYGFDTDGLEQRWRAEVGLPEQAPRPAADVEPLPTIPPLGGQLPRPDATSVPEPALTPTPTVQGEAVAGVPQQDESQPTPTKNGGSGCNRSGGDAAGIDLSFVGALALGARALRRRTW